VSDEPITALTPSDSESLEPLVPITLTLLVHPDTTRLGSQAHWYRHNLELSRLYPNFGARPIEDYHVSRTPLILSRGNLGVVLRGGAGHVRLQGQALVDGALVGNPELREGVVISLGQKVHVLLREGLEGRATLPGVLGGSPELERVRRILAARQAQSILLCGPPGSGKTYLANAVAGSGHRLVLDADDPLPSWERMADATGGTLIVEGIDRTSPALQEMLARYIEPWGAPPPVPPTRVIATSRSASPELLPDLEARLTRLVLPPLLQRREDIAAQLGAALIASFERARGARPPEEWLRPHQALDLLFRSWPGNSRQLAQAVRQLVESFGADPHPDVSVIDQGEPVVSGASVDLTVADAALFERIRFAIAMHLDDPDYGVEQLAGDMAQSPRQLHRTVLRLSGRSPIELFRSMRMFEAQRLLRTGTFATVAEIAAAIGQSPAHFSRVYQTFFGRAPSEDLRRR
jgi:AraC-like DNA-binding protein